MIDPALLGEVVPERVRDTTGTESRLPAGGEWVRTFSLSHLAAAEVHYAERGYAQAAVPWIVSAAAYCATKPEGAVAYETIDGYLVASAEQSFMQMLIQGERLGRLQALTPCFRNEEHDRLHLPYFMKLELVDTVDVTTAGLERMVEAALEFHGQYVEVDVVAVEGGSLDVVTSEGIELGSYGIREMTFGGRELAWVYGTGCAEPRLTQAIEAAGG